MSNYFVIPLVCATLFCFVKYIEEVYIEKNDHIAIKTIVRDGILVFLTAFVTTFGVFGFESHFKQIMNMITETKNTVPEGETQIFTDSPGF